MTAIDTGFLIFGMFSDKIVFLVLAYLLFIPSHEAPKGSFA